MKAKNKLLLLAMYVAVLIGFASIDSLAATSAQSGNWNSTSTWVGGVLPTSGEDVTIAAGHTVVVNLDLTDANGNRSVGSLTIANTATLRPDAGVRNIEIDNDLTINGTGVAQYNYLTTGRLNWTFTGVTDGIASISSAVQANTQFHNLSFAGAGVNASSGGAAGFTVYGDMSVSSLSSLDMNDDEVLFNNTTAKSITNNNTITWASIELADDAVVNYNGASGSDNNVEGNFDIGTDATLNIVAPTVIDLTTAATTTITNDGNLNFASGTELNCETSHNIDLSTSNGDINNFNGDLSFTGTCTFTLGARSINGTGTITTSAATTISLANTTGVKGAIVLSGTRTFNAATNYTFTGDSDTGFNYTTGNDVTSVGTLTVSGSGVDVTTADSFTITGDLSGASAVTDPTFIASAGTITFGGSGAQSIGDASGVDITFFNLAETNTAAAVTLDDDITIAGSLTQTGAGAFAFVTFDVTMTGTGTLTLGTTTYGGANGIIINGASANVTLGGPLDLGATGTLDLTLGTLDLATFNISTTAAAATTVMTFTAGTVRSSAATGLLANIDNGSYANDNLSVDDDINYEFYGSAVTNMNFDIDGAGTVAGTGGGARIITIGDLTIEGTNAITSFGSATSDLTIKGDIIVEDGASLVADANVTFNTTGSTITNNNATSADLTFEDITINGAAAVAVSSATSFTINGSLLLDGTQADAFTMSAGTLTFTASGGAEEIDGITGTTHLVTLNNLTLTSANNIAVGTTQQSVPASFVINGNITVSGGGDLDFNAAQGTTLAGFGKTITIPAATDLDFGDLTITGTYTDAVGFDVTGDGFVISGQFNATAGTVSFTNAAIALTSADVDSLSFFNVSFAGTAADQTANFTVKNNFTNTAATFDFDGGGADGGDIKFTGNPSTIIATATATETVFGDITVPSGAKLLMTNADLITLGETMTLTGTLEVNDDAQITGAGLISSASGSELIYNDPAGTGGFAAAITATGVHVWNANMNLTVGSSAAAITDLGLDVPTTSISAVGNLTLNHITSALADLSVALTVNGNFSRSAGTGTVALADAPTNQLTFAGTSKTFTNLDAAADLTFDDVVISGSYSELATSNGFGIGLVAGSAGSFTVNTGASWTSTLATNAVLNINSTTAAALVVNGTGTALFNDVAAGANAAATAVTADYTVQGDITVAAGGELEHTAASLVTLTGTGGILANNSAAARTDLTFGSLTVNGTYTLTSAHGFAMAAAGVLTVGSSGSLAVNSGTIGTLANVGVAFINAGSIAGTGTKTFGVLNITAGTVTSAVDFTINGGITDAFDNNGTFTASAGTVTMANTAGATSHLAGAGTYTFNDLAITGSAVLNDHNFTINGDLTVSSGGSFVSSAGAITFAVAGDDVITNAGTLTFFDLVIAALADNDITTSSSFNIAQDMTLGAAATFTATDGTITFNGTADQDLVNSNTTTGLTFYNLSKTGTNDLLTTTDNSFNIKGDITAGGTSGEIDFQSLATNGRLFLNGTAEQNIILSSNTANLIEFGFVTINNAFGVKLVGATSEWVTNAGGIRVYRTLRLQSGDLDLNGNNILRIDETNGLLSETSGNTVINSGTAASVGYVFVDKSSATFTNNNMNGIGVNMTTATASTMKIKRYSISRNVGSVDGISRVFSIVSGTTTGLDAKAVFRYDDSELNGLTAADLKMTRTDDQITGPWYLETSTVNTTNRIITVDDIDGFTTGSEYEYWTATAPVTVTTAELTKGLVANPLVAGRTEQAIYGLEFSANGDVDVNEITFGLDRDVTIANEFSKYYLVKSGDNDYATEDDNEVLISGTNGVPATLTVATAGVTFDISALDEMVTAGTKLNYFLVVDVATNVTTATSAIGATFNETNLDVTNGIAEAVSENGTDYTFKPGLMIDQISNGLTQSPLIAGTTNNGLVGFQITSTSNATDGFDTLFVGTNVDVTDIFSAVRLVRSTTNDVTTGTLTTVKTGTISADGIAFNNLNEASTTTAKFYFLVGDVKSGVDRNTSSVVLTIADEDLNDDANAGPRFINAKGNVSSSFSSPSYSFAKSEVTVSETTPLVAQSTNLGRGVNNQPVFRFTLASDNFNPVSFTKVVAHATLAKGLTAANVTAWRLWYDANGNDYPDTGEQISTGVYNASATQGNLTFDNFTAAQTTSSSRKYIVTVNLAVGTTVNSELSLSLLSQSYVTVTSPAKVNPFTEIEGDTYTVKAPGTASTAKIVGLSTNSVISGGNVSFTVRVFDASDVPANLTSSASVALNVAGGGFTFGGTTTGTILAGGNFVSITPTMSHATGTTTATVTATLSGGLALTTAATQNITVFKSAPSTNGTVTISTVTTTTMQLSGWTAGTGGSGRIVVISATTPPTAPTNGVTYTANTNIGSGGATAQTGPGSFVVATGASAVTTISGLTPGVTYYVQVFEYDGSGSTIIYNTSSKTSVAVDNAGTITGNPAFKATTAGSIGGASLVAAVNISTDVDVTASITSETEAENGKWFKFKVNSNRNNFYIKISDLPANYSLYLYDNTTGNELLFRTSEALSTTNDAVIVNNATAGEYLIRVFGADNEQYDASTFGLKVVTSASEVMSLEE